MRNNPYLFRMYGREETKEGIGFLIAVIIFALIATLIYLSIAHAEEMILNASWYSIESLKREGTYKYSKGVMANGQPYKNDFHCASRDYPLNSFVRVTNPNNGRSVVVQVTDRINKRFKGKRVDLSARAFAVLAKLSQGIIPNVRVERI